MCCLVAWRAAAIVGLWGRQCGAQAFGIMGAAARFVVPPSKRIVFSGLSLPAVSCRVLLKQLFAQYLVRIHRESTASKTDTPLFISLALHPAKPSDNAGFCSYLLTYEEIGTTSNPSCSARRVNTISV